jgi:HK97 family phage major capsid protein
VTLGNLNPTPKDSIMNLIDQREKRNRLMHEATAILQAAEVTAEQRTKAHSILADVDALDVDIAASERIAAFEAEQRSNVQNLPNPSSAEERTREERSAMAHFVRTGEKRDILTSGTTGGAIIPQAFAPEIVQAQKAWGGLYNIVKLWNTENGAPMKTSLVNATGTLMAPTAEGTTPGNADPTATSIIINTEDVEGLIKVSLDELQDSAFDLDSFLRDVFGQGYFRSMSALLVTGSTSGNIGSVVTPYATNKVTSAAVGTVAYADLAATYGLLDPAYEQNSTWVMNSTTRAALIGVTDTLGRPLFIPSPNAGAFDSLLGRPLVLSQAHANVATGNTPIQLGDFQSGYKLRVVKPGLTLVRINGDLTYPGMVGFYARARVGGAATNAGTPAIVNLAVK